MTRKIYVLGSGAVHNKRSDHVYVDYRSFNGVDKIIDLEKTPWPIADGAAKHLNVTHVLEHIRNFPAFMDECWRICSPGGSMFFAVPHVKAQALAFSDPTHVRFFTEHSFINYVSVEGVHQHGIFQHAWTFVHFETKNGEIRGHLFPVPDEARTQESIAMWRDYIANYSHMK